MSTLYTYKTMKKKYFIKKDMTHVPVRYKKHGHGQIRAESSLNDYINPRGLREYTIPNQCDCICDMKGYYSLTGYVCHNSQTLSIYNILCTGSILKECNEIRWILPCIPKCHWIQPHNSSYLGPFIEKDEWIIHGEIKTNDGHVRKFPSPLIYGKEFNWTWELPRITFSKFPLQPGTFSFQCYVLSTKPNFSRFS